PTGITGKTVQLPPLFILFQNYYLSSHLPAATPLVLVSYDGIRGGRGGKGGRGGNGGHGAAGTSSKCTLIPLPPFCICDRGPGKGGDGGNSGRGGKGGPGGRGGDGGTITIAAPDPSITGAAGFFAISNHKGYPGYGGNPGNVGSYGT